MHVPKWNLQLNKYMGVCFKFEIRAEIAVLNNFWTKSVSYKSKPIPVSRNAENAVKNDNFSFRYLFVA